MVDNNTVIEGTVKFRDGKKWKSRWCVMRKLSPVADCLHLQLYRDSKDRYKQGQTKASLSLQHFLGVESGFTLDKESNTIAIICQDVTVILAFDTRERLIQWQVKISNNLGEDQHFLIQITSAPPKAKIATGPARIHVQDQRFCITIGVPPRLIGFWQIGQLRRYGVVEGRFCFEGGSRCGKGEGLHVCVTDQGEEITHTFQLAAQGKLATRRRPVARKTSAMDSPRKQMHSRAETRNSDLSCTESLQPQAAPLSQLGAADLSRSLYGDDMCCGCSTTESLHDTSRHQSAEDLLCPCRMHRGSGSPFWSSAESAAGHHHTDLDSNYGCGDTASVSELPDQHYHQDSGWSLVAPDTDRRVGPTSLERCASCISKLGAPSMSRSSTATNTNTPTGAPFSPAWTMDTVAAMPPCMHHNPAYTRSTGGSSCDRVSLSSHGSAGSSGNSEYSVPRFVGQESCWYDRPRMVTATPPPGHSSLPPVIPPKSPKTPPVPQTTHPSSMPVNNSGNANNFVSQESCKCQCCPPSRPPKPPQILANTSVTDSPSKKKMKKPPMPLPVPPPPPPQHVVTLAPNQKTMSICLCHHAPISVQPQYLQRPESTTFIGPYENYDVPKSLLGHSFPREHKEEPRTVEAHNRLSLSTQPSEDYYDTPKNIKECLTASGTDITTNPQYSNYDTPPAAMTLRKACGCVIKYAKKTMVVESTKLVVDHDERTSASGDCPCQRVMCWAENWMMLPYCRRGNGMENTGVPIHKVKLSGEGKMPVMNPSGEIAIYATIDKSKKANRRQALAAEKQPPCSCGPESIHEELPQPDVIPTESSNYVNVEPLGTSATSSEAIVPDASCMQSEAIGDGTNYENIDFAQSLEYYENSRDLLTRAGISRKDIDQMTGELVSETDTSTDTNSLSYTINNGVSFCNKCGHACHIYSSQQAPPEEEVDVTSEMPTMSQIATATANKQDDYLMMEPAKSVTTSTSNVADLNKKGKNFPGYLPMSPITNACNKAEMLKLRVDQISKGLSAEKSASTPSLAGPAVDRSRKRNDSEFPRIPGSAMMMMHHSANSPYLRRLLIESNDEARKFHVLSRKRSSSADSSRYLDELEDMGIIEQHDSTQLGSSGSLRKNSVPSLPNDCPTSPKESFTDVSKPPCNNDVSTTQEEGCCSSEDTLVSGREDAGEVSENVDDTSSSSGSLRTLVRECLVDGQPQTQATSTSSAVYIRRSSSVPCKSGNNRDSSSSNDSGVSTGSLKHRGADFAEFELPLTTSMSTRRHHHAVSRHPGALTNCLHASLPRRSKSVDPLRELSFQFQKIKIPAKSSSAEAEVPICPTKRDGSKGFASPGADGVMVAPYMDSRSTSSGTSDMSDYIETLSLSSHSSSDTPDSLRLGRPATTTLRPRSGKEYQLIDRSILETDIKGPLGSEKVSHQLRLVSQYANITPVPEKSESPSPGYMSGSPGQDREDQPLIPHTFSK